MQTKYKLPKDVYFSVLWIVRGQIRRETEYNIKYSDILEGSGAKYISRYDKQGNEKERVYLPSGKGTTQSTAETKALALHNLDELPDTKIMLAVQQALTDVGQNISNPIMRQKLQIGILNNINDCRNYTYSHLNLPGISRDKFYEYKSMFLYFVAKKIKFI